MVQRLVFLDMLTISKYLFIFLIFLVAEFSWSQFTQFQGGSLYFSAEGNLSPFDLSSPSGARGSMEAISTVNPSAGSLFGNPAALSRIDGLRLQSDLYLPGLGLGVSSERTKILRNQMRGPIDEFLSSDANHVDNPGYPDVSVGMYQGASLSGFSAAFGSPQFALAAGFQRPLYGKVALDLGGTRLGLGLPLDASDPLSDSLHTLLSIDASAEGVFEVNNFALGAAFSPWPFLRLGLSYQHITADFLLDASARVDGLIQRSGQESFFNAEGLPYSNSLNAAARGRVSGSSHGFVAGSSVRINEHWGWDALLSIQESLALRGDIEAYYHKLYALDTESESILQVNKMSPTKLTLTQREKYVLRDVSLSLPWKVGTSFFTKWPNFRLNLDYAYFIRGLSFGYTLLDSLDAFDSTTSENLKTLTGQDSVEVSQELNRYHLSLSHSFSIGIEVYQIFAQVGGYFYGVESKALLDESSAYKPDWLPFIPSLNFGYYFPLGPNFKATVSLLAFPVSLFKTSVEYHY